jgi:type II secretory pathway component PulK
MGVKMAGNRGIALITVLWIMVILEMVAASLIYITRLQVRLSNYRLRELQALTLANAGTEKGAERIYFCKRQENLMKNIPEKYPFSGKGILGEGEYAFSVENEEAKINLNNGSRDQLLKAVLLAGASDGSQLADFVLARRKEGKKFISLEELDGQPFWSSNNRVRLEKYLTVFSNGQVNINGQEPELVLTELSREDWNRIRAYRNGKDGLAATADDRFIDAAGLKDLLGDEVFEQVESSVCYRGQSFLVRARAVLGNKVCEIKRWVRFDYKKGRLIDLCWQES